MKRMLGLLIVLVICAVSHPALAAAPVADFSATPTFGVAPLVVSFTDLSSGEVDTWAWDLDDDSMIDSVEQHPSFQYTTPGVYTVTFSVSGPEGGDDEIKTQYITVGDPTVSPQAGFSAEPTSGGLPLNVQFTDQSTGGITEYFWEFGDGQTSTDQHPLHTYVLAGTFTVKLTVTGPLGLDLMGKVDHIQAFENPPIPDFFATPTSGGTPLEVVFTDLSSGLIDTWSWDFDNDGAEDATEQNPAYTYDTQGTYTVALTTTGPGGGVVEKKIDYMTLSPNTVADFSASTTSGQVPLSVVFTDESAGSVDTWSWDFDSDGTEDATEQHPAFTFETVGTYTVTLSAGGPSGSDMTAKQDYIHVGSQAITAEFTAHRTHGPAPLAVSFSDQSSGTVQTWAWDFDNNGTTDASDQSPSFTYTSPGTYSVTLAVSGVEGSDSRTKTSHIQVDAPPPSADFAASPLSGTVPLGVQFTDYSSGTISGYLWDFGDGQTSTEQDPYHEYQIGGDHTVFLTVTGPDGSDGTGRIDYIHVGDLPPTADFMAEPTYGEAPLAVQFTDQSSGVITDWAWDFEDDGTIDSSVQHPAFTYTVGDTYSVKLLVTGPGGSEYRGKIDYIHVGDDPPVADFTASPTSGVRPLKVQFENLTTGTATTYLWDFGDGHYSTAENPEHDFHLPATYTITLTATGPGGSHMRGKDLIHVAEAPPTGDFMADPTLVPSGTEVEFTDLSTGTITSWLWDFGDGQSSTEQHPTHIYQGAGDYTILLDLSGPGGTDSVSKTDYVSVTSEPVADFGATPVSGPRPLTVTFSDRSMGTVTGYNWDFGDGESSTEQYPTHYYVAAGDYTVRLTVTGPDGSHMKERTDYIHVGEDEWWSYTYGAPGLLAYDRILSTKMTANGAFIATGFAAFGADLWITELNQDGTIRWEKGFTSPLGLGDYGRCVETTSDGGYIVAGDTYGTGDSYHESVWIIKFNRDGTPVWQRVYGDDGMQRAYAIQETADGGYIIAGESNAGYLNNFWVLKLDFNGTPAWEKIISSFSGLDKASAVRQTSDGGYIVAGQANYNYWVIKLNSDGAVTWEKEYNLDAWDTANDIRQTSDGGYIVIGNSSGKMGVLKLYGDGTVAWQKTYAGTGVDLGTCVRETTDGGFVVAGRTTSFGAGDYDGWILKLNGDGTVAWEKTYGGTFHDGLDAILEHPDGGYVASGWTESFGDGYRNYPDGWVLRVDTNGDIPDCPDIGTSSATVEEISVVPEDTSAEVFDTYILPEIVDITAFDTPVLTAASCSGSTLGQANYTADPTSGVRPLTVQFTDLSTGTVSSWLWDFGDGQTSTEQHPLHLYTTAGDYTVSLTIDGLDGMDEEIRTDYIHAQHVANFTAAPTEGVARLTVYFDSFSQEPSVAQWIWDFGDGTSSTLEDPTHKYFDVGYYTVSLTVRDAYGEDTITKTDYIGVIGLGAPHINKLVPKICLPKEKIKVKGYNFGEPQDVGIIRLSARYFDQTASRIKIWENRKIKIKVPNYKCDWFKGETYRKVKVQVIANGGESNILKLQVLKPASCP